MNQSDVVGNWRLIALCHCAIIKVCAALFSSMRLMSYIAEVMQ